MTFFDPGKGCASAVGAICATGPEVLGAGTTVKATAAEAATIPVAMRRLWRRVVELRRQEFAPERGAEVADAPCDVAVSGNAGVPN